MPEAENDERPLAIVAASPWRPTAVHIGETGETLTLRGRVATSGTVGLLVSALKPGPTDRWDELGAIDVRFEGEPPRSASAASVLAGANRLAIESAAGWEIVSFRDARLTGAGVLRLTGLLRGRQGTEAGAATTCDAGCVVVVLDDRASRLEFSSGERGLPRLVRAGPEGASPGGTHFTQTTVQVDGVHDRPWSPTHLRAVPAEGGLALSWIPRVRKGGDGWGLEPEALDGGRFRVRVFREGVEVRRFEVDGETVLYPSSLIEDDFPAGLAPTSAFAVGQFGPRWGWGPEAISGLFD